MGLTPIPTWTANITTKIPVVLYLQCFIREVWITASFLTNFSKYNNVITSSGLLKLEALYLTATVATTL